MLRRAVKLGPQQEEDFHDRLASDQLREELASSIAKEESRRGEADAKRRLHEALKSDFQDFESSPRPPKRRLLPWSSRYQADDSIDRDSADLNSSVGDNDPDTRPPKRRTLPWPSYQMEGSNLGRTLIDTRAEALRESTQSSRTQWPGERSDVPPIQEADRARYQKWLESSGFPAASDPKIWEAICTNWIGFLSATGSMPKHELAPCRKVVTWSPRGFESPLAQTKRFKQDRKTRRCIQEAVWLQLDVLQTLAERWPVPVRTIVNQAGLGTEQGPFEGWAAKINLTKRRRGDSILAGLVCFLVHSHDEGTLEEMGLELSEDVLDSIVDVKEADAWYGQILQSMDRDPGPVEKAMMELLTELITDSKATFRTNPLLWWVGVLVKSSLQTDGDDYISRGRFDLNILTMDMDIAERLEAILHYSKVFVLDHSMKTWKTSASRMDEVRTSMAAVDMEWLNADDDQRPAASADMRTCQSAAWKDMVKHVRAQSKAFLGDQPKTVARQLRALVRGE